MPLLVAELLGREESMCLDKLCCYGLAGAVVLLVAGITSPATHLVVRNEITRRVVLENGSMLYGIWQNPTESIPVYLQFYPFDVMNPDEVTAGGKPYVVERGPYTYREYREKYDIKFNDNGTVSYRENVFYKFDSEMSNGEETDCITTVNMVLLAFANAMKFSPPVLRQAASIILSLTKESVFHTISIRDLVWGYDDPLLVLGNSMFPSFFYTSKVGILAGKNNTDYGEMTVFTGVDDLKKLGIIDKFNGTKHLPFWTTPYANMINGSDGSIIPPFLSKSDRLYVFSPDICRSVYGVYHDTITHGDVPVHEFLAADAVLVSPDINPDNIGFCTPQDKCFKSGVLNITQCKTVDNFHIPLQLSLPHFLKADPEYRNSVSNLHPDERQHTTQTLVEPNSGILFHVAKRMQMNILLQNYSDVEYLHDVPSLVFPILWMNETASIDEKHAQMILHQLIIPLKIVEIFQICLVAIGIIMLLTAVGFAVWKKIMTKDEVHVESPDQSQVLFVDD